MAAFLKLLSMDAKELLFSSVDHFADQGQMTTIFRKNRLSSLLRGLGLLATLTLALAPINASATAPSDDIRGIWIDHQDPEKQKVAVMIEDCNGSLCGHIYWMKKPLRNGRPKTDIHNPDQNLRERPLCGLRILSGFKHTDNNTWSEGHIYSPSDGNTFNSTIRLEKEGTIKIRGFIGISLFGKTLEWVRPAEKLEPCS